MHADDTTAFYHPGMREVQARMDSTRLADRLEQITVHDAFTDNDRAFIEAASMVFVATADAHGHPDCSYKGGRPGFIRVLDATSIAIPIYDGNGQYRTLGNITVNPSAGLLFVDFEGRNRLRVNGAAHVVTSDDDAAFVASFAGAEAVIVVTLRHAFPNCPRYLHDPKTGEVSKHAPAPGYTPPQPEWKSMDLFRDALPAKRER